jgi:broad specificity phosphatase PhoE
MNALSYIKEFPNSLSLIRHAQSERNLKRSTFFISNEERHELGSHADPAVPLTDEGRRQAEITSKKLVAADWWHQVFYHSGYVRTKDTAEILHRDHSDALRSQGVLEGRLPTLVEDHRLRERFVGACWNMTKDEADRHFPWLATYWREQGRYRAIPPCGESLEQMEDRIRSFCESEFPRWYGRNMTIVTHGGPIWCFRRLLEGWSYEETDVMMRVAADPKNCSITTYMVYRADFGLSLHKYNKIYYNY